MKWWNHWNSDWIGLAVFDYSLEFVPSWLDRGKFVSTTRIYTNWQTELIGCRFTAILWPEVSPGGTTSDVLYSFTVDGPPSSLIEVKPTRLLYLPVTQSGYLRKIGIRITDQRLNLNGEDVTLQLYLKKVYINQSWQLWSLTHANAQLGCLAEEFTADILGSYAERDWNHRRLGKTSDKSDLGWTRKSQWQTRWKYRGQVGQEDSLEVNWMTNN